MKPLRVWTTDEADPGPTTPAADRTADFLRLLGRHERALTRYVLALVPHWEDADEVLQQTRIRLWEQFEQYDPAGDFGAWSRSVAYYLVLAHRTRKQRQRLQFGTELLAQIEDEAARLTLEADDRHRALADCLGRLPDEHQTLLRRCYAGEETINHVAAESGRTANATRQLLYRLRQMLHECIQRTLRRGEPH